MLAKSDAIEDHPGGRHRAFPCYIQANCEAARVTSGNLRDLGVAGLLTRKAMAAQQ